VPSDREHLPAAGWPTFPLLCAAAASATPATPRTAAASAAGAWLLCRSVCSNIFDQQCQLRNRQSSSMLSKGHTQQHGCNRTFQAVVHAGMQLAGAAAWIARQARACSMDAWTQSCPSAYYSTVFGPGPHCSPCLCALGTYAASASFASATEEGDKSAAANGVHLVCLSQKRTKLHCYGLHQMTASNLVGLMWLASLSTSSYKRCNA
jgi:hypothetical protein